MKTRIAENSKFEARDRSRLPELSPEWINRIRGTADFLGLNYYTSRLVSAKQEPARGNPSFYYDMNLELKTKPEWKRAKSDWLFSVPSGLGDLLRFRISL